MTVALGLMSGTSLDGIDAAVIETDGETVAAFGAAATYAYEPELREALRGVLGDHAHPRERVAEAERRLTDAHADAVRRLLADNGLDPSGIAVVGFHGHTLFHDPGRRRTCQIGDGTRLAAALGIDVVADFRSADVAAGGQGAPLAPLYHAALARPLAKPLAVLNIGGVANLTWVGPDGSLIAFDTGPGNAPLDDLARVAIGAPYDRDGALAAAGRTDEVALSRLCSAAYLDRPPPKSLDRDDFDVAAAVASLGAEDAAATITGFICRAVRRAAVFLPARPERWLVTGGGRRNPTLMAVLADMLDAPVDPVEAAGWDGDALEAQAFAFLAVRSLAGLPLSLPETTGVPQPMPGGRLFRAPAR